MSTNAVIRKIITISLTAGIALSAFGMGQAPKAEAASLSTANRIVNIGDNLFGCTLLFRRSSRCYKCVRLLYLHPICVQESRDFFAPYFGATVQSRFIRFTKQFEKRRFGFLLHNTNRQGRWTCRHLCR